MASKNYIITLPPTQAIVDTVNDQGQLKRVVRELISGLQGVQLALESISSGDKLFEIWELRRKLNALKHPKTPVNDARFIVVTTEERDFILAGMKRFDWTVRGTVNFWIRWEDFFKSMSEIKEFDEKNPPVEYVEWKRKWDADIAEAEAEKREAEAAALAKKAARDAHRDSSYNSVLAIELDTELARLKDCGKLGSAATVEDVPESSRVECIARANAAADAALEMYDANELAKSTEAKPVDAASNENAAEPAVVKGEELSSDARPLVQEVLPAEKVAG
jgi:hypothetical protein